MRTFKNGNISKKLGQNPPTHKSFLFLLLSVFYQPWAYTQKLSESIKVSSGAVNGVFIERNGRKLVIYGDPNDEIRKAEMVLFTHFRRDVIWAGRNLVEKGSLAIIPFNEKEYFTRGDSIWIKFALAHFIDPSFQTKKIEIKPMEACRFVQGGETLLWQDIQFRILETPGYTRGSVSYIADIDNKRIAFVGDLMYGDGKILDFYSFQDALKPISGYHGYAVRLGQLIKSLQLIAGYQPDYIIPSRGPIITNPELSIQKLIDNIHSVYQNYLSISAYRWYYPEWMKILSDHVLGPSPNIDWMPYSSVIQKNLPTWLIHFSPSNLILSEDSSAFLIDCGKIYAFNNLLKLKETGYFKRIDGIFVTHYHSDHANFINDVVKEFHCPVYITGELKEILENPVAFNMPVNTTDPVSNLTIIQDGEKMIWKEFTLTFYYFPGQTLYHDAVLFEKTSGESVFFIGDSFTPTGVDDYCLLNRNLLHPGMGYLYCLDFLKKLPDNILLANQHIEPLFAFSRQQLDYMTDVLLEREAIFKDLFPWENINYGIDEQWARIYPYSQKTSPGQTIDFSMRIFNHSDVPENFAVQVNIPERFRLNHRIDSIEIESLTEGEMTFKLKVPEKVKPGIYLITADIKFDEWDLREWSEAVIEIL